MSEAIGLVTNAPKSSANGVVHLLVLSWPTSRDRRATRR